MKSGLTVNYLQKIIDEAQKSGTIYITLYALSSSRTMHVLEVGKYLSLIEFKIISPFNGGKIAEVKLTERYRKFSLDKSNSGECEAFVPMEYKELFWQYLKENTNFYVGRGHHKKDIENALDYVISKIKK